MAGRKGGKMFLAITAESKKIKGGVGKGGGMKKELCLAWAEEGAYLASIRGA